MMSAFAVLSMRPVSVYSDEMLDNWGNESITKLADFYGNDAQHKYSSDVYSSKPLVDPVEVKVNVIKYL